MNDTVHCSARFRDDVDHEPHEWTGLYRRDVYHCPGGPPPYADPSRHLEALRLVSAVVVDDYCGGRPAEDVMGEIGSIADRALSAQETR